MKISEIFKHKTRTYSFEFFPPKKFLSTIELGINVGQLIKLSPSFISVTYGAGGSTQETSFELLDFLQNSIGLTSMAHYTCVNATKEKVENDLDYLLKINIENLMLLRGDPPKGEKTFTPIAGGLSHANELVQLAFGKQNFSIGVGGFPEKHPESSDFDADIKFLKLKVDAGADFIVTQMFFENKFYFDYVKAAKIAGVSKRIIPGIIPIINFKQIKRFSELSQTYIPQEIVERMSPYQDNEAKMYQIGVDIAIEQSIDLLKNGAPGLHFYTLNKSQATVDIFESLPKEYL